MKHDLCLGENRSGFDFCLFFSTDADGSECGGGHQQTDRRVGVSVLQGPAVVHGGRTEGRTHRPVQDPQLPRRAEEQQRTRQ